MVKMNDLINKNYGILKESIMILFKKLVEYKGNLYAVLFEQMIYLLVYCITMYILFENFSDLILWSFNEFILFFIICDFLMVSTGVFLWRETWLSSNITQGNFNSYLTKPVNTYFLYFLTHLNFSGILFMFFSPPLYFLILFYFGITFLNYVLGLFVLFLLFIFMILVTEFVFSMDWLLLGLSDGVWKPFDSINDALRIYPGVFFDKFKFKFILFMCPFYFVATLLVPIFFNKEVLDLWFQIYSLIGINIVLFILTCLIWSYGLRHYEAYG